MKIKFILFSSILVESIEIYLAMKVWKMMDITSVTYVLTFLIKLFVLKRIRIGTIRISKILIQ